MKIIGKVDLKKVKTWDAQAMTDMAKGVMEDFWNRAWVDQVFATGQPFSSMANRKIDLVDTGELRAGLTFSASEEVGEVFVTGYAASYADKVNQSLPFMGWTEGASQKEIDAFRVRAGRLVRQSIMRSAKATPEAVAARQGKLAARAVRRRTVRAAGKKRMRARLKAQF